MLSGWLSIAVVSIQALLVVATSAQNNATNNSSPGLSLGASADCLCGFFDPTTDRIYTDSLIVYFNETKAVPQDVFNIDNFRHRYEKGLPITYVQGASTSNVGYENGSDWNIAGGWLNLNVNGYGIHNHLVNGAQLQTVRQDIQYGTFRSLMKSPAPYAGGTALVMKLAYNETSSAELDVMNMDSSTDAARISAIVSDREPTEQQSLNFTTLEQELPQIWPWGFCEYRIDWDAQSIDWYYGPLKTSTVSVSQASLTDVPAAFYLKHWSNGDQAWMQGPPQNNTVASIGWVRLFFNSSISATRTSERCTLADLCSTEDETLRISTAYDEQSKTRPVSEEVERQWTANITAVGLMVASGAIFAALVLHLLFRRILVKEQPLTASPTTSTTDNEVELLQRKTHANSLAYPRSNGSSNLSTPLLRVVKSQDGIAQLTPRSLHNLSPNGTPPQALMPNPDLASSGQIGTAAVITELKTEGSVAAANPGAKPANIINPKRARIDYLAGLVALCSLIVSCTHFILTFVPAVIEEYLPYHYESEYWARRTVEPFLLNEVWVGLFFTTSTRFLTTAYLRSGNLKTIAEKIVCRTPRLMIPIAAVILLEYFLMDCGAVKWVEYIPSITWTTWISTSVYPNFGWFLNATLQLIYLIPNAAPQITWYYATGVLWTIPVQLQNAWLVLLGVVIVCEIKTPSKRFGYYAFCIINNWYGLSWGSYFWFGLLLADLDITYKYRKTIQGKWYYHYPLLTLAMLLAVLSLSNDLFSIHFGYTFSTEENGIHPDAETGLPISQTANAGYPSYIEPKLHGLVFCVCAQYIVELSTWAQKLLSTKPFLLLFPHVFTIYLIHGLVFWSIGSLVCVHFAGVGLAFWLNILLTAIICYVTLFACLPIVTPVMEMLGKEVTKSIWISASEEPPPWRPVTFPFSIDEVLAAYNDDGTGGVE